MPDLTKLTKEELQHIVFMTGSKKAFGTYMGLEVKKVTEIWTLHSLELPLEHIRSKTRTEQLELLASHGSMEKMALYFGCSPAALKQVISTDTKVKKIDWAGEDLVEVIKFYGSVSLASRCKGVMESAIRSRAKELGIELAQFLDYTQSEHSNAKGRRAELDYSALRKGHVVEDLNLTQGSQASADFVDDELGVVNVKSSRAHAYRAKSRGRQEFGKFSTSGYQNCDRLVCMLYDKKMTVLLAWKIIDQKDVPATGTVTILRSEMNKYLEGDSIVPPSPVSV